MGNDFQITISLKSIDGFPMISITGECDAFSAPFTHGAIVALITEGYKGIIIDIHQLKFLDVAGFHALDDCCKQMAEKSGKILLVSPTSHVTEVYDILKDRESCKIVSSIDEAVTQLPSSR